MEDMVDEKPLYGIDWCLVVDEENYPDKNILQILSGDYVGSKFLMSGCSVVEHEDYAELKLDYRTLETPEWCNKEDITDNEEIKNLIGGIVMECLERYCGK